MIIQDETVYKAILLEEYRNYVDVNNASNSLSLEFDSWIAQRLYDLLDVR